MSWVKFGFKDLDLDLDFHFHLDLEPGIVCVYRQLKESYIHYVVIRLLRTNQNMTIVCQHLTGMT